jgi:mannan endo-1,4-beta-mannosidase
MGMRSVYGPPDPRRTRADQTGNPIMRVSATGWANPGRLKLLCVLSLACLLAACSGKPGPADATGGQAGAAPGPVAADGASEPMRQSGFVQVRGTGFVLDGKPYRFAGANFWYGAYLGAPDGAGDRERLRAELDQLKAAGIDNLRVLAMSEASGFKRGVRPAIMSEPGKYDEQLLQGLDYLLAEMARRDMKAVLYLNNFWQWSGGMSQYVAWATGGSVSEHDPDLTGDWNGFMQNSARFYAIPEAQAWYRDAIRTVIGRTNSITGTAYADDPTVMPWQLANEPRPGSDGDGQANADTYVRWIDETAGFIHGLAPKQLVSTGSEGEKGSLGEMELFVRAHATPNVDYLTFHLWPSNWSWIDHKDPAARLESGLKTSLEYIDRHIDAAGKMGKPIVLSEFGLNRDQGSFSPDSGVQARDRFYQAIYARVLERMQAGDAIAGSNFWAWGGRGRTTNADWMWAPGDPFTGDPPQEAQGLFSLFDSDASTLGIVSEHARAVRTLP